MGLKREKLNFNQCWVDTLADVLHNGISVMPRGMKTFECPQYTHTIDMRRPVLTIPERKLHYGFMAAEAYWILTGDNTVKGIAPYNKNIENFSDDGKVFFGAYGPPVVNQLDYVVNKLLEDRVTRQAGLTIWRQNPPHTKDVPCTVAMFFNIRFGELHCSTYMRSSDLWLGLPYDVFNFSMLSHLICCRLNEKLNDKFKVKPGYLYLTAFSSHLYEEHFSIANEIRKLYHSNNPKLVGKTNKKFFNNENFLMYTLKNLRDSKPGSNLRWWEK